MLDRLRSASAWSIVIGHGAWAKWATEAAVRAISCISSDQKRCLNRSFLDADLHGWPNRTEEEGREGVLLSSLLLAVNLAKEVKWRGSSIVANKKEVPLLSSQLLLPYTLHPLIAR